MKSKKKRKKLSIFYNNPLGLLVLFVLLALSANFAFQIYKKPTDLVSIVYEGDSSDIEGTWERYKDDFIENETHLVPSEVLAAIAQVETAGRMWASPPWIMRWTDNLEYLFSPMSSAVGLMQITKGHFDESKKFCVNKKKVTTKCSFKALYNRMVPSHSIELSSVYLYNKISNLMGKWKIRSDRKVELAALIHLCGEYVARKWLRSGYNYKKIGFCGSHNPKSYAKRVVRYSNKIKTIR